MKGWNGELTIEGDTITIERGLRGSLLTRGRKGTRRFSVHEVKGVWFCPGRKPAVVGYLHVVTDGPGPASIDYLACARDPATVTFTRDVDLWRALAARICALSGCVLEEFPAPEMAAVARRVAGSRRREDDPVGF